MTGHNNILDGASCSYVYLLASPYIPTYWHTYWHRRWLPCVRVPPRAMLAIFVLSLSLLLSPLSPPTSSEHTGLCPRGFDGAFVGGSGDDSSGDNCGSGDSAAPPAAAIAAAIACASVVACCASCAQPRHLRRELRARRACRAGGWEPARNDERPLARSSPSARASSRRATAPQLDLEPAVEAGPRVGAPQYVHAQAHRLRRTRIGWSRRGSRCARAGGGPAVRRPTFGREYVRDNAPPGEPNAAWRELLLSCTARCGSSRAMRCVLATRYHEPALLRRCCGGVDSVAGGGYEHRRAFEAWHVRCRRGSPRSSSPPSRPGESSALLVLSGGAVSATRPQCRDRCDQRRRRLSPLTRAGRHHRPSP